MSFFDFSRWTEALVEARSRSWTIRHYSFLTSSYTLSSFEGTNSQVEYKSGGDSEKVTPVPMPNTEVKLLKRRW